MTALVVAVLLVLAAGAGPGAGAATQVLPGVGFYPRVVRLRAPGPHQAELLATTNDGVVASLWRSADDGATFAPAGTIDPGPGSVGMCCHALFVFPRQLGPFPAGTLLYATSVTTAPGPPRSMDLRVFRSQDNGATWPYVSSCATSTNGGLWEPDFHVANDGSLVCVFSDETDAPAHSQTLQQVVSTDGGQTWGPRQPVVVSAVAGARPGMATTAQLPDGTWVMTYEVCAWLPNCAIWMRRSVDGASWGDPGDIGDRVLAGDGSYLAHTPVLGWSAAGGPAGTLVLSGQLAFDGNGDVAPGNGRTLLVSRDGGASWVTADAPVPVVDPYDNFCPNYSSPVIPLDDTGRILELASAWQGPDCVTSYGTGTLPAPPPSTSTTVASTTVTSTATTSTTAPAVAAGVVAVPRFTG